ncbi:PREDICTED: uncharacterized protein LOC105119608 [Populus euphratica]|uniref:Uncharacterized protein LOC105119608 n=1 Tax=Populus euphratica TaxID=75702 RepID=A0AAJ6TSC0_POPEU|nr:PREDICTED: uncharacterized protein LOC105119608 [Populus euphratica]
MAMKLFLIQKRFLATPSASSSLSSSSSSSFTVDFLVNSCGLPLKSALLASRKLKLDKKNLRNPPFVLQFLKSHNFDETHISKLIERRPQVLQSRVEGNLAPRFEFLIANGFVGTILSKRGRMVYAMNAIKNLGLEPDKTMFVRALSVRLQMTESTWNKKIEVMKSLRWSEEEILRAFKRYPQILAFSEEKIRSAIDFYINTMELERQIIIANPNFIGFSIDKRIRPRYNVINVLESKELIKGDMKISTLLVTSEKKFFINYVSRFADEVPGLLELYKGTAMRTEKDA